MNKKRIIIVIVSVVLLLIVIGVVVGISLIKKANENLENLNNLVIDNVDLTTIADGEYTGSYSAFPVSAEVKVKVTNHTITEIIIIEHNHGQGADAENIIEDVVSSQSLVVDTISGATYSSKVILKAIENALKGN